MASGNASMYMVDPIVLKEAVKGTIKSKLEFMTDYITSYENGMRVVSPRKQETAIQSLETYTPLTPYTTPTSFDGSTVEFRITNGMVNYLKDLVLEMKIHETGSSNSVTPLPMIHWFTKVEIWGNGGDTKIQTLYPHAMQWYFGSLLRLDQQDKLDVLSGQVYTTFVGGATTLIAAGEYGTYMTHLWGNIFQQNHIWMPALQGDVLIRFFLRSDIKDTGSGALGSGSITYMTLQLVHDSFNQEDTERLTTMFTKNTVEHNYLDTVILQKYDTYTASATSEIELSSLFGVCPYLLFGFITNSNNVAASHACVTGFASIGSKQTGAQVKLISPTGENLVKNHIYYPEFLQSIYPALHWPGQFSQVINIYPLVFGDVPGAEEHVVKNGFFVFNGDQKISITFGSGWSTGSFNFWVWARMFRHCHLVPTGTGKVRWDTYIR